MLGRKELRVEAIAELCAANRGADEADACLRKPLIALRLNKTVFEFMQKAGYGDIFDVYCLHSIELFGDDGLRPSYRREVIDKMREFGFVRWADSRMLLHTEFCARNAQDDGVKVELTPHDKFRILEGKHMQWSEAVYANVQSCLNELAGSNPTLLRLKEAGAVRAVQWICERVDKPEVWTALATGIQDAKKRCEISDLVSISGLSVNAVLYYCRKTGVSWCSLD